MGNQEGKLLLIGLDNSGKTTILSRLTNPNLGKSDITPTIGYKKQKFDRNGVTFEVFDMSGQSKYRDLWQSNANSDSNQIDGIIFVADASDKMRLNVARSQLQMILENQKIPSTIPYLFYANKTDIKGSCSLKDVSEILELNKMKRQFKIFQSCGTTGAGIEPGIDWLSLKIKTKKQRQK